MLYSLIVDQKEQAKVLLVVEQEPEVLLVVVLAARVLGARIPKAREPKEKALATQPTRARTGKEEPALYDLPRHRKRSTIRLTVGVEMLAVEVLAEIHRKEEVSTQKGRGRALVSLLVQGHLLCELLLLREL